MVNIAINARYLLPGKMEGVGRFSYEIISRLVKMRPDMQFHLVYDRKPNEKMIDAPNVQHHTLWPQARHPLLWYIWTHISLPRMLHNKHMDVWIGTEGFVPLRSVAKQIAVIHDLNFEHIDTSIPPLALWYYKTMYPRYAAAACKIITVSQFSSADIQSTYHISPEKIEVVYNAASPIFEPRNNDVRQKMKQRMADGAEYFVYLGSVNPRKNVAGLLKAFEHYKNKYTDSIKLVIVGNKMHSDQEVNQVLREMKNKADVLFTGYLNQTEMIDVLASAEALVYVPFYEGFGIPVIEAMQCGVPVLASGVSSLPEVTAGAALLVNPYDVEEISHEMRMIRTSNELRLHLANAGKLRAAQFNWDFSALKMLQIIESVLHKNTK